jgi:hypothetical protein
MKRYFLILIALFVIQLNTLAQASFELGFLPSLNINKKLPKDWSLNFKTESRQSILKDDFNYDYLLTDISLAASKKISINTSVAAGYLMRIDDKGIRNRTLQQISFVRRYEGFRLSHRFLADQTFEKDEDTEFRFRYRLSSEIPLQGKSLDPNEFFLKFSNEYLSSFQEKNYDLEIRGAAFIGYVISPKNLIEIGIDNRLDSFLEGNTRNRMWIGLNFYTSF